MHVNVLGGGVCRGCQGGVDLPDEPRTPLVLCRIVERTQERPLADAGTKLGLRFWARSVSIPLMPAVVESRRLPEIREYN